MSTVVLVLAGVFLLGKLRDELPKAWSFVVAAAKVPTVLEQIVHEFSPNSGSSMRDSLNRLEIDVAYVKQHGVAGVREALNRVEDVEDRVAVLEKLVA